MIWYDGEARLMKIQSALKFSAGISYNDLQMQKDDENDCVVQRVRSIVWAVMR